MGANGGGTRRRIVEAAYDLFYRRGYARVGVEAVAEAAGVTKRTLYYHFRSKDDLLAAAVERHHELAMERVARWAERLDGDAPAMVEALFAELARWAARPDWRGAGFTRLVMELADLPGHPARAIARRHKAAVEARIAAELARRGVAGDRALARELMLLLEGCLLLVLVHGDRGYADTAAAAARRLLAG